MEKRHNEELRDFLLLTNIDREINKDICAYEGGISSRVEKRHNEELRDFLLLTNIDREINKGG